MFLLNNHHFVLLKKEFQLIINQLQINYHFSIATYTNFCFINQLIMKDGNLMNKFFY